MNIKVKKLIPEASLPVYATEGAACFDLHACLPEGFEQTVGLGVAYSNGGNKKFYSLKHVAVPTGLSFEIPKDHVMLVFSRSGHGFKNQVRLQNCVGVIDSDYRGEVKVALVHDNPTNNNPLNIKNGDRIAQAMILPVTQVSFEEVSELSETERGEGGFGSTGK
jgi:dUTP pyrophosphatase